MRITLTQATMNEITMKEVDNRNLKAEADMTERTLDCETEDEYNLDESDDFGHIEEGYACYQCFSPFVTRFFADLFRNKERPHRAAAWAIDSRSLERCSNLIKRTPTEDTDQSGGSDDKSHERAAPLTEAEVVDRPRFLLLAVDDIREEYAVSSSDEKGSYQLANLELHKILGEGQFGQVWLASDTTGEKQHRRPFALKVLSKYDLITCNEVRQIITETQLLAKIDHPFIVRLEAIFQDESLIYLLQEFCQGGELFSFLCNHSNGLPESQTSFYTACVADALAYLHEKLRVVYRDLKPENCMIDASGYPILIDMGYAKILKEGEKTYTFCGTPRYLAPECIKHEGHSFGADHWSLGALVYEMLVGFHPFFWVDIDETMLFENIVNCEYDALPSKISTEAVDFVSGLLMTDPAERLGFHDENAILGHAWLNHLDLTALRQRQIAAPWIPMVGDALDTSCFDNWEHLEDRTSRIYPKLTRAEAELFAELG